MTNTNETNIDALADNIGKSLNLVMLIDDHDISNFMTQQVVINTKIAKKSIIQPAGFSAINYLLKHQENLKEIPDVIFLDLDMPVMNGSEFLTKFATLPFSITTKCKIVILSGYNKKEELEPWFKKGTVIYYMIKPLKPSILEEFMHSKAYYKLLSSISE